MAAKAPSVKRYVVRLSAEERQQLEAMIRKGKSPAQRLSKARIPLEVGRFGRWRRLERQPDHRGSGDQRFAWSTGCASNWWKKGSRPS